MPFSPAEEYAGGPVQVGQRMAVHDLKRLKGTGGERIQSFALLMSVFLCVVLCASFLWDASGGADVDGIELESRINPNDAPISSLVRLPGIGMSRAAAIVAYRDAHKLGGAAGAAFRDCNDLQRVKGIGPKTAGSIAEWLVFESE